LPHGESFWRKYVFSTDHKVIGLQYLFTSLLFLFLGYSFMMVMRYQLAYPGQAVPMWYFIGGYLLLGIAVLSFTRKNARISIIVGATFLAFGGLMYYLLTGDERMPGGVMLPEFYNSLGAMHGTIMVFFAIVPMGVGAFGNYLVPLMIGAPDMAFPKLNMSSYWTYVVGGVIMLISFFLPGGAANSGWTAYPPLADIATIGQTFWLLGMVCIIASSTLSSINIIATIIQLRTKGMTWMRMPFFVWAQLITSLLLLLAMPPLEAAGVLQLLDRVAGTSFFLPSGLVISGQPLAVSGGGSPLLWQHLMWFLGHPEVYVILLPSLGIVAEVLANNLRRPLWGYKAMVRSVFFLGFMSMIVWAHHMFMTGMGTVITTFFQTTTMIVSIPTIIILSCFVVSMYDSSIRFNVPMLFVLGFLPMLGIGGLTGLPLGLASSDIPLHDTMYVIGHFHYVVAPGAIFAVFAGIYYWYPKITGRKLNETLGKIHFFGSFVCMNVIFFPMLIQGLAGVSRRLYDGGAQYAHAQAVLYLNPIMSIGAWVLALFQIIFIINFFRSMKRGEVVAENPWQSTTLEWATPTPPLPHGNFPVVPEVYCGPYEYSVPGSPTDFNPQNQLQKA